MKVDELLIRVSRNVPHLVTERCVKEIDVQRVLRRNLGFVFQLSYKIEEVMNQET